MKTCSVEGCEKKHEARGFCSTHYARWKRIGSATELTTAQRGFAINSSGYRSFSGNLIHRKIAETAFGKTLPKNSVVHHVDYDKTNNSNSNLVVCSRAYHKLIHQRTDALNACGNASWRICTICKKYDDPNNLSINGTNAVHNKCRREKHKAKRGSLFYEGWLITANGKTMSLYEWEKHSGINRMTITTRIKELGWNPDDAVSKPARKINNKAKEIR